MKVTETWLREWVNPNVDMQQLAHQLTMAGLEVDSVSFPGDEFSGVVVGEIMTCGQHPNADKLSVCEISIGESGTLPIVCGGDNLRVGMKVALATVGAILPGDFKIKKSKLRGEPSHGMICSAKELGIDQASETPKGIMELAEDAPLGVDIREYLNLDDAIIDIELTPNRGDCASVKGIAYEVSVLNNCRQTPPHIDSIAHTTQTTFPVTVTDTVACPRYIGRVINGINTNAKTPLWMLQRLQNCGIRCIHPVVDICNYVMLELGQPMHGFDLAKLKGGIEVRLAKKKEQLKLLDEQEVELTVKDLVIADKKGALAIAGIMGGFDSSVSVKTTDVFLESAFFEPVSISLTARRHGLNSDSSYRFERGVDPTLQQTALERASALVLEICGGEVGPLTEVTDEKALPKPARILLRRSRIAELLGVEIKDADVERILESLGMQLETDSLGWYVARPSRRFDISREVDLVEEVARIYGYGNIPTRSLIAPLTIQPMQQQSKKIAYVSDILVDRGYHEVISYSFVNEDKQRLITPNITSIPLQNPISQEMNVMRTSLLPGLLDTMLYNQNRQLTSQKLFEVGRCFCQESKFTRQSVYLGMLACGEFAPAQWGATSRLVDFFDLKGDLAAIANRLGVNNIKFRHSSHAALHPGKSADLYLDGKQVGFMGVLHPGLLKSFGLRQAPVLLEVAFELFANDNLSQYEPISKFPAVRRDLALIINKTVSAQNIIDVITKQRDNNLNDTQIFDLYEGEGIEKGKKSIALGLTFQDPSRTLVDADINSAIERIIKALQDDLKATLRT